MDMRRAAGRSAYSGGSAAARRAALALSCKVSGVCRKICRGIRAGRDAGLFSHKLRKLLFDPNARSGAGACGLMQLMPTTAKWFAENKEKIEYSETLLFQPEYNIRLGCAYLRYLNGRFDGEFRQRAGSL